MWLLLYSPIAFALFNAGKPIVAVFGAVIVFITEPLPDRDMNIPVMDHRGASHTIVCALLIGGILGFLGYFLGDRVFVIVGEAISNQGIGDLGQRIIAARNIIDEGALAGYSFAFGTFGILTHLVGDVITPMGIKPFWPLSSRSFSLSLTRAKNPIANGLLMILGAAAAGGTLFLSATGGQI
jgi:inner membrane protein